MLSLWKDLLNLIFPLKPECPFCREPVQNGKICTCCMDVIEGYRREPYCCRCGRLAGKGAVFSAQTCSECRKRDWPFVKARAAGPYEGLLKEAIHRFKYKGRLSFGGYLAGLMAEIVPNEPLFAEVNLLVPVPLSAEKLRQRGFNQAAILAREVGAILKIPVEGHSLVKTVDTLPQTGLSRSAREFNMRRVFKVTNNNRIQGRNILIIDDVFTTGSTMSAAATALAGAGAGNVFCLTVATGRYF